MIHHRMTIVTIVLVWGAWSPPAIAEPPAKPLPTPPPRRSLPAIPHTGRVGRSFDAEGITTVVLRAGAAKQAEVKMIPGRRVVTVSGIPEGGAAGYHPADLNWRETPASEWGLDFMARRYGPMLVISTVSEIIYIHHDYHFAKIVIEVPQGIEVIREDRQLSGEPTPDLSPRAHLKK